MQTLRETLGDYGMGIHAHRAMHASFDKNPRHGISMYFLAKLMRMIGVDQIHAGTAVGKLVGTADEVRNISDVLRESHISEIKNKRLHQNWASVKRAFPVTSGGLHPGLVPDLMRLFGDDCVILISGGIHGHPRGTRAGAMAAMQAIQACKEGETLEEHAKYNKELREALDKWGRLHPK